MNIVIRVDSSQQMGSGHLVRCKTLAEELRRRGADVRFICREHRGNLSDWLSQSGFPVTLLPAPPEQEIAGEDYQAWLGVSQETDATEAIAALAGSKPDWLIVDHYGLDRQWETLLRPHVQKIFVIDDLANRPHDCDGLLDQNENLEGETRYAGLVPEGCRVLVGCRYALLRPEYAQYRATMKPRTGEVKRIFIFFGGTDSDNMTGMAIAALSSPELQHLTLDVVIGATNPHRETIELQGKERGHVNIYGSRPHLADLMAQADLAIGAGGTTTWERCCLGLPTLVVSLAVNQVSACLALEKAGAIDYVGSFTNMLQEALEKKLCTYLACSPNLRNMEKKALDKVDGLGTVNVVKIF